MNLSQRWDLVVLVLLMLYVLTGCTITTDPRDLGPCLQWADVQQVEKKCTMPLPGGERVCAYKPYITSICVARENSNGTS